MGGLGTVLTALCSPPRPTVVSRTTTINYIVQENIPAMYVTGVQVPIGAVASGQEGELHSQFKPNLFLPLHSERSLIHTALHQTGPRPIMYRSKRNSSSNVRPKFATTTKFLFRRILFDSDDDLDIKGYTMSGLFRRCRDELPNNGS